MHVAEPKGSLLKDAILAKGVRPEDLAMATAWGVGPTSGRRPTVQERRKAFVTALLGSYNNFLASATRPARKQLP